MPIKLLCAALLDLIPAAALLLGNGATADESVLDSAPAPESLSASELSSLTRIKWQCTEQPALRVVVNAQGILASEMQSAKTAQPVQIHAIKLEPDDSGTYIPAKLISTENDLASPAANWSPDNSITTSDGRLRLDLTDKYVFLAKNEFGNQTLFRHFDCETAGKNAPIHYQCEPDFDLWVRFTKARSGASDPTVDKQINKEDSAVIQYTGGQIELPQAVSGSGARYARADSVFWIKGSSATFTLAGDEEHRCQAED
ncbi:Membrane-bound lysozyme-inhibitor of c-type lysozyme [Thiorhodovibrio winogradskyi]|uniref:Membrane-bound lysozyme-inhibitor of c-type lysozyme n=1 Tax=Thiorhodovibrio winogradskyi TaxID=77007 RepID=A0ABZ0SBN9_9GAMM|nr:MliC family protein [Thiorhodovibrio winogradskyi]